MTSKGVFEGVDDIDGTPAGRGEIAPHAAEGHTAVCAPEGSGDFLFELDHADIAFGKVVVERYAEVIQEGEDRASMLFESFQEIARLALFGSTAFSDGGVGSGLS